jgi:hypothetical protein
VHLERSKLNTGAPIIIDAAVDALESLDPAAFCRLEPCPLFQYSSVWPDWVVFDHSVMQFRHILALKTPNGLGIIFTDKIHSKILDFYQKNHRNKDQQLKTTYTNFWYNLIKVCSRKSLFAR